MRALCISYSRCSALVNAHVRQNPWVCCAEAVKQRHRPYRAHQAAGAAGSSHSQRQRSSVTQATAEAQQQHTAKQYHRFYAPQLPAVIGAAVELEPDEARHAVRVLRLKQGDPIELCDGKGGLVQCEVAYTDKSSATVVATANPQQVPWQGPQWVVAAACLTLKGGRTDWLIEKATELGAFAVLPLITERSQTGTTKAKFKSLSTRSSGKAAAAAVEEFQPGRLERLALAATKQSLRVHALQLLPATSLGELLPALQQSPVSLVATAGAPPVMQVLQNAVQQQQHSAAGGSAWGDCQPCYLLIGPEGDFTPSEVAALADAGVRPVGLGSNRLRTETAAMALLSAAVLVTDAAASAQDSSH